MSDKLVADLKSIRPTVLLVEDDAECRASLRLMLQPRYEVVEARDGAEAVEALEATKPALVLLDLRMPKMDGFEFLEAVMPGQPDLPVVVLTGIADSVAVASRLDRFGHIELLQKPVDQATLLDVLRKHGL